MLNSRRRSFGLLTTLGIFLLAAASAQAEGYPGKPVIFITSTPAGNGPDVIARIVADRLGQRWNQQVLVDNRPGGRAIVATLAVTQSAHDGYTLYVTLGSTYIVLPQIQPKLPFDLQRDLAPIALVGEQPFAIAVNPKSEFKTLAELIAFAKKHPEEITYGAARGSMPHLVMEAFQKRAGIKLTLVPYSSTTKSITDVLGGRISFVVDSLSGLGGSIQSGQLVPLAVTAAKRLPDYPNLPTIAEIFPGFEGNGWFVLTAPTGTPEPILQDVNKAMSAVLAETEVIAKLAKLGTYARPMSTQQVSDFIRQQREIWVPVVTQVGLTQ